MIKTLISIKRRFPGLWRGVEGVNGLLFRLRYRRMLPVAEEVLRGKAAAGCSFAVVREEDLTTLESFIRRQPEESFTWFHPHSFDRATLERLFRNPSFLMMQVRTPEGETVGYFFLRGFFIGQAFAGLLVDKSWQNQGIGTAIWASCAEICSRTGLRMEATVSTDNKPSIASCRKGTEIDHVRPLENTYVTFECREKK